MTTQRDTLDDGLRALDMAAPLIGRRRAYWAGKQPAAFLTSKTIASLDARLRSLSINLPRLYVGTVCERLDLMDVTVSEADAGRLFREAGGVRLAPMVHTDVLATGSAYVTAWTDGRGRPRLSADSAETVHVHTDQLTGESVWAVRRWTDAEQSYASLMEPGRVTLFRAPAVAGHAGGPWEQVASIDNGLDAVPVVPFRRQLSTADAATGVPLPADIYDLTDALCKITADALVTSEYFARPRRWATGLEIETDENGRAIDPFGESRLLQSEDPETRFGQLDPPSMAGYVDMTKTLLGQVGALTGLPAGLLGIGSEVPSSAEALSAGENALVQRADTELAALDPAWREVGHLLASIGAGVGIDALDPGAVTTVWADTQSRTPAQDADAAAKLAAIGIPLSEILTSRLRYTPADAARIAADAERAALMANLGSTR